MSTASKGNIQNYSAHIEPGRDGLFSLIKSIPRTLNYESGVIVAEGDFVIFVIFVIIHGRFSGFRSTGLRQILSARKTES
jgi:hypothetical protein